MLWDSRSAISVLLIVETAARRAADMPAGDQGLRCLPSRPRSGNAQGHTVPRSQFCDMRAARGVCHGFDFRRRAPLDQRHGFFLLAPFRPVRHRRHDRHRGGRLDRALWRLPDPGGADEGGQPVPPCRRDRERGGWSAARAQLHSRRSVRLARRRDRGQPAQRAADRRPDIPSLFADPEPKRQV